MRIKIKLTNPIKAFRLGWSTDRFTWAKPDSKKDLHSNSAWMLHIHLLLIDVMIVHIKTVLIGGDETKPKKTLTSIKGGKK